MKVHSVFEFQDYKLYLAQMLATSGETRGARARLAEALHCQSAFISQVIHSEAHFSLEHAVQISLFLKHTPDEKHFFMLLVQLGRAGNPALREYYEQQLVALRAIRQEIRQRIQVNTKLSEEAQMRYYSAWYYSAVHILLSIPQYQSREALAKALTLPTKTIAECLEFLVANGLAVENKGRYTIGTARIHLPPNSPMISKHHTNWRTRALYSLDAPENKDLHYSAVVSLSQADVQVIRNILLKTLETTEPVLKASPEETCYCLNLDFFTLLSSV